MLRALRSLCSWPCKSCHPRCWISTLCNCSCRRGSSSRARQVQPLAVTMQRGPRSPGVSHRLVRDQGVGVAGEEAEGGGQEIVRVPRPGIIRVRPDPLLLYTDTDFKIQFR